MMRAATVAVLAASIALIATWSATPAAASLLHPPNTGHLNRRTRPKAATTTDGFSRIGNATVQWQFNASWLGNNGAYTVKRSTLEPYAVLAYAPRFEPFTPGDAYLFALNATTGKLLWKAEFAQDNAPQTCIELIETPTTVACLGMKHFVVAARYTSAAVASGMYAPGYQLSVFGNSRGYIARLGQHVALTMLSAHNSSVAQALVLDAVTGTLTSMGAVTAPNYQAINTAWGGSLRQASSGGPLEWTVVFWSSNPWQPVTSRNDVFTTRFSSVGVATIVAQMPPSFSNGATGSECAHGVPIAAYPDLDVVLAVTGKSCDVQQAYFLNGTKRFAIQQPAGSTRVRLTPGFSTNSSASDGIIVLSGCNLTSINAMNETNWQVHNCSVVSHASSRIVDVSGESIVVRGVTSGFAANLSAVSGATQWLTKLGGEYNWENGYWGTEVDSSVDVFGCAPLYAVVRKADGATVASIDTSTLWWVSAASMDFHETPGAPTGTGTLVLGSGTVLSVAVTPQL